MALQIKPGDLLPLVVELTMSIPAGWNSIAMPKGGLGFTDEVGINELTPPAVCFLRERKRRMADRFYDPTRRLILTSRA